MTQHAVKRMDDFTQYAVACANMALAGFDKVIPLDETIAAVGLEAGPLSQWLYRGLTEAGLDVVLMETGQVKGALKAMPIKTDRRDAEGIARLLHLGWFPASSRQICFGPRSSRPAWRS